MTSIYLEHVCDLAGCGADRSVERNGRDTSATQKEREFAAACAELFGLMFTGIQQGSHDDLCVTRS